MLKRLLTSELKNVAKRNLIAERKFSEMLERAVRAYTNRSLDAAGKCSSKVQQPHRTAPTVYDRQSPLTCANDPYRLLCL
jgi:Domain of unknown function (DUF3387)